MKRSIVIAMFVRMRIYAQIRSMLSRDSPRSTTTATTTTSRHLGVENKISGLTGISSPKKTWAIFQRNKLPESFGRASNESLVSRLSSLLRIREPWQSPVASRRSRVATPCAACCIGVNAVYAENYTLDRSFHGCAARWKRKLDPREKTSTAEEKRGLLCRRCHFSSYP